MREVTGDLWTYLQGEFRWICVPTNGSVNAKGQAVMGRGVALQAAKMFPGVRDQLGEAIRARGNRLRIIWNWYNFAWPESYSHVPILAFPVKYEWNQKANVELIAKSAHELHDLYTRLLGRASLPILLPRVGCGNGKLQWASVKPILQAILCEDTFIIVSREEDE